MEQGSENPGSEMARAIETFVNNASKKTFAAFAVHVTGYMHRTLQQKAMGLFMTCIEHWAICYDNNDYDARNEATVKLAKKIINATANDRYLPTI